MRRRQLRLAAQVLLLLSVALGAAAVERYFFRFRVVHMRPEIFAEDAIELRRTDRWIWGYYPSDHGAGLARAPRFELERDEEPWSPEGLTALMERDLRLLPWRIAGEMALYLAVAGILAFGAPWLARRTARRKALAWGIVGALAFMLFVTPHVATGYGVPLYSNWWGPMPRSYTTPPFGDADPTMIPGDTISYRPLLEWVLRPGILLLVVLLTPLRDSEVLATLFRLPYVLDVFYWTVQIALYFLAAYLPARLIMTATTLVRRARARPR